MTKASFVARHEQMNGRYFASPIDANFDHLFRVAQKGDQHLVQDGDPSQNSGEGGNATHQ